MALAIEGAKRFLCLGNRLKAHRLEKRAETVNLAPPAAVPAMIVLGGSDAEEPATCDVDVPKPIFL
jgi:hypothetical protein